MHKLTPEQHAELLAFNKEMMNYATNLAQNRIAAAFEHQNKTGKAALFGEELCAVSILGTLVFEKCMADEEGDVEKARRRFLVYLEEIKEGVSQVFDNTVEAYKARPKNAGGTIKQSKLNLVNETGEQI